MRMNSTISSLVAIIILALLPLSAQAGVIVGAGTSIPLEVMDTASGGPRNNVDRAYRVTLGPGTYQAALFSFAVGRAGSVTPYLAALNAPGSYTVVALGDTASFAGAGTQTVAFGGSDTFSLAVATDIYLGIINPPGSADNPIYLDNGTATTTDHDGTSLSVIDEVGDVVDGFSNPDLGRTYAVAVTVEEAAVGGGPSIPEPAVLGLVGLALLGLKRKRS
jgi:PEP-CTERM motif-containing protein